MSRSTSPEHKPSLRPIVHAVEERAANAARSVAAISSLLLLAMGTDLMLLSNQSALLPLTVAQGLLLIGAAHAAVMRLRHSTAEHVGVSRVLASLTFVLICAFWAQKLYIAIDASHEAQSFNRQSYRLSGATVTLLGIALAMGRRQRLARYFVAFADAPARQSALSFIALALFGGVALTLPVSVRDPLHANFIDALFMSTSAVCVTGLAVHSVAETYTPVGQLVLLSLVQVGGLGIMVLSASMTVLSGRRMRAKSTAALAEMLDADSMASLRSNIVNIVGFTLVFEALGALLLYLLFANYPELSLGPYSSHPMGGAGSRLWAASFHAISAFCNAGFSLMRDNLVPFANSPGVCAVVMLLVIVGGLGFPVLSELTARARDRARGVRPPRLSLHTRLVLILTLVLNLSIGAVFCVLEWGRSFAHLPIGGKLLAGVFQAVTLRTAGFNTVDITAFAPASMAVACLFMFVGAAPGGTGGGIKLTTFAVLFAAFRAEIRGAAEPTLLDRRVPEATLQRAISVSFVAVVVLTFALLTLLISEPHMEPIRLAFEAVSAFATVGLSAGATPTLSAAGKVAIIIVMLIGRVGPLTFALAASERGRRAHHHRPQERVLIG